MTVESHPEYTLYRWGLNVFAFCLIALPAAVALGVGLLTHFGRGVEPVFFEVMAAGVLPVFLVACILQYAVMFGRVVSTEMPEDDMELMRYEHKRLTRLYGLIFLAGESCALYAVAANAQSTFLAMATCLYSVILLFMLLGEIEALSGSAEEYLPGRFRSSATRERRSS